ncbi:MAG: aminopeptidase P family protein [Planctomycetaceae bacterium]|nr:aminopeptidase P family protein [Planctomycetaceae bacterium]MCB9950202.1 aminopeptidase P family protein [Planctomycetaceae bacterium]
MSTDFKARRNKVRTALFDRCDALLVTNETNVTWLTGFSGDSTWLLLTETEEILISDFRYLIQLDEECPGVATCIRKSQVRIHEAAADLIRDRKIGRIGVESHALSFESFLQLNEALGDAEIVDTRWEIEEIRSVKDEGELQEIREAVHLAAKGFDYLKAILTPEITEVELAHELEHAMRRFGADGVAFPPIIAVGDRGALPHYRPGDLRIKDADTLLVDWGAQTRLRYKSDLTRTLVTGELTQRFEEIYNVVLAAQEAAIAAIRPGKSCAEVDAVARDYIAEQGFGEYFDHGLGHGFGLNIHEQPRFSKLSTQVLEAGMVVTVEPGIYVPGWGGIRIEDDVVVTSDGYEVLSAYVPKSLESSIIHGLNTPR